MEGKGPSQLESSPEATGKQDVGSFRLHRLRVGRGEVLRHGEGIVDMASRGASGRSFGHNGKTGHPGPNASKSRQGSGGGVRLGDAPRKHGEGAGMGDREGGQGRLPSRHGKLVLDLTAPVLGTILPFVHGFIFIFPLHIGLVGSYWKPRLMPGSGDTWVRRADCNLGTKQKIAPSGKRGAERTGGPSEEAASRPDLCYQSSSLHKV